MTGTRFERLVMPHLDAAYTLARYLINDPSEVDDVLQEAVLRGVQYFHTLEHDNNARAWFLTIVRRECYTAWARRDGRMDSVSLDTVSEIEDVAISPEQTAERSLLRERIVSAVGQLPGHLREVIVLRELQQLSYDEIAVITESPMGTVMSRISRARARLAASLRGLVDVDVGEMS
ncbi:MAG: sigma-70 family RNA polymerase sigma factor [Gemmatimonadaceae bacterium]